MLQTGLEVTVTYGSGVLVVDHLVLVIGLHLESFPGPDHLRPRVSLDLALKEGVSSLGEAGIPENLLKDGG